jgi:serine/threonine protein kinase
LGTPLKEWLAGPDLSQEHRIRFSLAIANALRILHKSKIAHLDLKPANILIEENRKKEQVFVRLIDLDAARIDGVGLRDSVYGTDGYASPEHCEPHSYGEVSEASDVFTLGIILFELLFRVYPFRGTNYRKAVTSQDFEVPPSDYHRDVVGTIVACLRPMAKDRPTAGRVHSMLYEHHHTSFEAVNREEKWLVPTSVTIEREVGDFRFTRTYYRDVDLGSNAFRGSGLNNLPSRLLRFRFTPHGLCATLMSSTVEVRVNDEVIRLGSDYPLPQASRLWIGGVEFSLTLKPPQETLDQ